MVHVEEIKTRKLRWKNIVKPQQETLEELEKKYGFHELDLEDCLSKTERPKVEDYKDYVFIVFHFPVKQMKSGSIAIHSLNVFLGKDFFITLSDGKNKKLDDFFEELKKKPKIKREAFSRGSGYLLYELINELFQIYTPYISQLTRSVQEIEDDIFEGTIHRDRLYEIMLAKRQIITLKRALIPHITLIQTLEHLHKQFINKRLELYFDDVADKIGRSKVALESLNEITDTLHNANESLTSHNTNKVMKILTIFSAVMLPMTFVTGLYGMNVALPFSSHEQAFMLLMGFMCVVGLFCLVLFRMNRYI